MAEATETKPVAKKTATKKTVAKKTVAKKTVAPKATAPSTGLLAALLIRGMIGMRHDVRLALEALRIRRRMVCVVVPDNPVNRGLMEKCKDFITFGPVTEELVEELRAKRGSLKGRDGKEINVFRMHPPRGGFGAKGIKVPYQLGGPLGLRREGMADLLRRMM